MHFAFPSMLLLGLLLAAMMMMRSVARMLWSLLNESSING